MSTVSNHRNRRLAAIMFTDIVGYTALMQQDEDRAANIRKRHRKVFEQVHDEHQGNIIQYFGDGTLSTFNSGVQAVECAIRIQEEFQSDPTIPLRIGLHIGDIVYDGTEIYGDGVNLASRVENMGVSGAILISESLNQELKNHKRISTASLGRFELKNVAQPMEIYAVDNKGLKVPRASEIRGKQRRKKRSIAVLPFVNMSSSADNEYFSDGMTEEIINALSRIKELNVTSRTSSFYFKGKNIPISQVGRELNVSIVLEGSVRVSGNKVRITAQLIDVQEDHHFWSERFDRPMEDIFAVQDEISLLIAQHLKEHIDLDIKIEEHLHQFPDVSVDIYQDYLKARYHLTKMSPEEMKVGLEMMKDLVKAQPDFALGHLGINFAYTLLGTIGIMPWKDAFEKGRPSLQRAIELDPDLPECQLNLAWGSYLQEWDLETAYVHIQKALDTRPFVDLYQTLTSILIAEGRFKEAHKHADTAMQIDPFAEVSYHLKGIVFYLEEDFEKACDYYQRSCDLNGNHAISGRERIQALILAGKAEDALLYAQSMPEDKKDEVTKLEALTLAYAALDDIPKAEAGISRFIELLQTDQIERALYMLIVCYTILGREEDTLEVIEQGVKKHIPLMIYLPTEPLLKPYRKNKKFRELMERIIGDKVGKLGY